MDKLYSFLFRKNIVCALYSGFLVDEITHYYPGKVFADLSYTPLIQEWFYTAEDYGEAYKGSPTITESHTNSQANSTIFTVSAALLVNGTTFSVSAIDVTMNEIKAAIEDANILDNGFSLLVSAKGIVTLKPSA